MRPAYRKRGKMMKKIKIAVIGAGASGLFAALTAAGAGASVTVFEHGPEAGRKLLMTGNGKCNLTNERMGIQYYYSDSDREKQIIGHVLAGFDEKRTVACFEEMGLLTYARDGYVYPQSGQAASVRDVLLRECRLRGVHSIRYGIDVYPMLRHDKDTGKFVIGGEAFDRLILACGGKSERQTGSDGSGYELSKRFGHSVNPPFPALVPLYTETEGWKGMAGVRAKAGIRLFIGEKEAGAEYGELQMTAQSISGIPVFLLSRLAVRALQSGQRVQAQLCFLPGRERSHLKALLLRMADRALPFSDSGCFLSDSEFCRAMTGLVNEKVLRFAADSLRGDRACGADTDILCERLLDRLLACRIPITGYGRLDHAQATGGGIPFDEVTDALESKLLPGLFFAGEMLDVDGICGGYNLQWAWSSGRAAAIGAVGRSKEV